MWEVAHYGGCMAEVAGMDHAIHRACSTPHRIQDRATVHFWNDFWELFVKKQVRICTAKVQTRQSNQQLKRAPEPILSEKPPPKTFLVLVGTVAQKTRPCESKKLVIPLSDQSLANLHPPTIYTNLETRSKYVSLST